MPRVVFCDPEVAQAGRSAAAAAAAGIDVVTGHADLADTDRTETYGSDLHGGLAIHADRRRGVLVGATAVGPLASEWIHVLALAIKAEVGVDVLRDSVFQFPTFSELVLEAVRALGV